MAFLLESWKICGYVNGGEHDAAEFVAVVSPAKPSLNFPEKLVPPSDKLGLVYHCATFCPQKKTAVPSKTVEEYVSLRSPD